MKLNAFNFGVRRRWIPKKFILIMKLVIVIILCSLMQVSAATFGQQLTLSGKNVTLKSVFKEIKKQTGYEVIYADKTLNDQVKIDVDFKDTPLKEVLDRSLENLPVSYIIDDKGIVIKEKQPSFLDRVKAVFNTIDVHGRVVDEKGLPLPGVTVRVKEGDQVTTTDANGYFTIAKVDTKAVIVISFIGYTTKEIPVASDLGTISMQLSNSKLDEVQVIAYGTTTQRLSTGNISTVKADDLERSPVDNVLLALEGRLPGVFITQSTGVAGGAISVKVQGQNSIASGNDPLYVVDGVPYPSQTLTGGSISFAQNGGSPLSYLNMQDIESISVLKDADATAIYGSRAANGAILITTKKGKVGPTRVNVNMQSGYGQVTKKLDMMNTQQYLAMRKQAYINDGLPVPNSATTPAPSNYDLTVWDQNRYTDWQKELIGRKAQYTDAQGSVSGGSANTQFLVGANYHKETTVFPGDFGDNRASAYFNLNTASDNRRFKMQFSGNYMNDNTYLPTGDLTQFAIEFSPNAPSLYNADGSLNWAPLPNGNSTWWNPLVYTLQKYTNTTNNLVSNAEIGYELLKGLILKTSLGYSRLESDQVTITPMTYFFPEWQNLFNARTATYSNGKSSTWNVEPQLTYGINKGFGKLDFLLGSTFLQTNNNLMALSGSGYSNDGQLANIAAATVITPYNNLQSVYKYNALFGRIGYNYRDKYLITLSARRDGSSRFGANNMFHDFYAVSAGWVFTNESWIKDNLAFLSFGKIKFSYGTSGNDQVGHYTFLSLYNVKPVAIAYGGGTGLVPRGLDNPYLQWEETRKANLGLDLGVFNNRVTLSLDYYRNRSSNQLLGYSLPIITGFGTINKNFNALVQNRGLEMVLNTKNIQSNSFQWSSSLNLTMNHNQLLQFPGLATSSYSNLLVIGRPLGIRKAYQYAGVNPATGTYQFIAADKTLTGSPVAPQDLTQIIDQTPKYYGGFSNNFRYKGFTLDILFSFVKQIGYDPLRFGDLPGYFGGYFPRYNQAVNVLNSWKQPGDISNIQRYSTGTQYILQSSDAGNSNASYVDASYIRLKNLSLSWSLPTGWVSKMHFQSAGIYLQGQNLLTFTHYPGDPETSSITTLPPLRVITLGIKAGL